MDENVRFPNRKKKNWDEPDLGEKLPDAELQEFNSESTTAEPLPSSGYRIFGSVPETSGSQPAEADLFAPLNEGADTGEAGLIDVSAAAGEEQRAAQPPISQSPAGEEQSGQMQKRAGNPVKLYAAAGVGLGILLVVGIAIGSFLMGAPNGRYDMGTVNSAATGLVGHLFIQWDKKLKYRLTLKPGDPDQQAAFALAVANPASPLSIAINLLNSEGFVLCSKEIVLKYHPRNAAALAGSAASAQAGKTDAGKTSAQGIDFAQLEAQEAAREQGKDIFQNQADPDGQIAAMNSQGDLPCSAESYEKTANWSFSPNFPSVAEQNEWLNGQNEMEANAERLSPEKPGARPRRVVSKAPAKILPFSIEGDDASVEFNLSPGIIQTRGRKTFLMDKAAAAAADPGWQDYPVMIHYRCDQTASCLLARPGGGALRVRLGN